MLDVFDVELVDCTGGDAERFLAEFTWGPKQDTFAKGRFDLWKPSFWEDSAGNPRYPTMRANNTHGYYLAGKRTFWVIGCARDNDEVIQFCKDISGGHLNYATPYWCKKIIPSSP